MVRLAEFQKDVDEELSGILSADFSIDVTQTNYVPHSNDAAITFPNLDQKSQGTKFIETAVLYVDMRRSTELSFRHHPETAAKLYSAFVRGMTRCAKVFDGEVRGIIGDRVMILFDSDHCFENAIDTAVLINSVCTYVINKHFIHSQVTFGVGIDFGRMLATKTGVRRHGAAQQSYRSLVWLGRPANVASKLTDAANKPEVASSITKVVVGYQAADGSFTCSGEYPHDFVRKFTFDPTTGLMRHSDPRFHSFAPYEEPVVTSRATPAILMTQAVLDGYRAARPNAQELTNNWYVETDVSIPGFSGKIYGGNVIYTIFTQ